MYKNVLVGLGTALLGCIVTPIAAMMWYFWKATKDAPPAPTGSGERFAVSFSPLGLIGHPWFWWFIIALGVAGFLISVYLQRTRAL